MQFTAGQSYCPQSNVLFVKYTFRSKLHRACSHTPSLFGMLYSKIEIVSCEKLPPVGILRDQLDKSFGTLLFSNKSYKKTSLHVVT